MNVDPITGLTKISVEVSKKKEKELHQEKKVNPSCKLIPYDTK